MGIHIYVRPIKREILHSIKRGFYACSKESPCSKFEHGFLRLFGSVEKLKFDLFKISLINIELIKFFAENIFTFR